jgi:putative DNA methylase
MPLTLCDRGELPFEKITSILAREAVRPRAIFQTHKWFARRLGSAFRALIASTEATNEEEFWHAFYRANTPTGKVVFDPFVGGGTSVIEAYRLGYQAIGADIDPAAVAITAFESLLPHLDDIAPVLQGLRQRFRHELAQYYGWEGEFRGEVPLHYFWVQRVQCVHCGEESDAHPHYRLAFDASSKRQWTYDPETNDVCELSLTRKRLPSGLSINAATVKNGRFQCPICRKATGLIELAAHTGQRPRFRLFALETVTNPKDGRPVPNIFRHFRSATAKDQAAYSRAEAQLDRCQSVDKDFFPYQQIPEFRSRDQRLRKYGYLAFGDLFNARQKLHLGLLGAEILRQPEPVRPALSIAFSNHLTTNCMLTQYAFGWRRLAPLFSIRAYRHVCRPVELNPWMDGTGRGSFPNAVRSIIQAQRAFISPKEPVPGGKFRPVKYSSAVSKKIRPKVMVNDSRKLAFLRDACVDLILSDPPYFDNIAYPELSAFFRPWMERLNLIRDSDVWNDSGTLAANGRSPKALAQFETGLETCFLELHRVLKDDGRLIFTFQHRMAEAWASLARVLIAARFEVLSTFPLLGERPSGLHKKQDSSSWDAVFVCRKPLSTGETNGGCHPIPDVDTESWLARLRANSIAKFSEADARNLIRSMTVAKVTRLPSNQRKRIDILLGSMS